MKSKHANLTLVVGGAILLLVLLFVFTRVLGKEGFLGVFPGICGNLKVVNNAKYAGVYNTKCINKNVTPWTYAPDDYNYDTLGAFKDNTTYKPYKTKTGTTIMVPSTTISGVTLPTFINMNCGKIKEYTNQNITGAKSAYENLCVNKFNESAPDEYNPTTSGSFISLNVSPKEYIQSLKLKKK